MSNLSQFFGSGGNETPGGIKIPVGGVPVNILGVAGGGGGGGAMGLPGHCKAGNGGAGAIFHATNYDIQPGCTVPVTIGGGGSPASCPTGAGGQGGDTHFNYPIQPLHAKGGGGGGACCCCCLPTLPDGTMRWYAAGCPGGNGGGAAWFANSYCSIMCYDGGDGCYWEKKNEVVSGASYASGITPSPYPYTPGTPYSYGYGFAVSKSHAKLEVHPWGVKGGFPGNYSRLSCSYNACGCNQGYGGKSGGNSTYLSVLGSTTSTVCTDYLGIGYRSTISGNGVEYNAPGTFGANQTDPAQAGSSGGLIIQWAAAFGGAPSFPGASDISPLTPGYYTYCFTSSGSITLP